MKYLQILFMSLLMSLFSTQAIGKTNQWAKLALQDLAAIESELQENHPGAVDPENSKFAQWMKQGYVEASKLAKKANSFEGYYLPYADILMVSMIAISELSLMKMLKIQIIYGRDSPCLYITVGL